MRVQIASEPGRPGRANEDFAAVAPGLFVVIDGAGTPADVGTGCEHSVAWYARHLGGAVLAAAVDAGTGLDEALAVSIERVNALHVRTCDLRHPGSPSATVALARMDGGRLEHLVLSDAVVVLDRIGQSPAVVTDDRLTDVIARLDEPERSPAVGSDAHARWLRDRVERLAAHRNRPGGFWVASTKPEAAGEALTGSSSLDELNGVALLSDGASRLVDRFGLLGWPELLAVLRKGGPEELIARTRDAEASDPVGARWPRGKAADDASAVWWAREDAVPRDL
ncbi:protein phosphatase 2C domain-containing protein [Actinomadura graeca]|uniref:Protein phosphatase 2C domain-containing protein n=1 Tax=Actinomadura graeca TaxID=2750812 RepID=A0ABX8QXU1_9ACTN|nr:protein phosphatase 2C domain-containing protein [Actinomadura graeca]QXJ22794.1 protein phosphatase 2C domain-containing protein [Actinomadura graeca]